MSISEETIRTQLLDAYIAKDDAEQKIKGLRNLLAGVALGRQLVAAEQPPAPSPMVDPE